jgi:hypothetical protein
VIERLRRRRREPTMPFDDEDVVEELDVDVVPSTPASATVTSRAVADS